MPVSGATNRRRVFSVRSYEPPHHPERRRERGIGGLNPDPAQAFLEWLHSTEQLDPRQSPPTRLTLDDLIEVAALASAYAEEKYIKVGAAKRAPELDCKKGCAYCCAMPVPVTVAEVLSVWTYALDHAGDGAVDEIRERAMQAAGAYPRYAQNRQGMPEVFCPLLRAGECCAYPARPLACRGWNSRDVAACRGAYQSASTRAKVPVDQYIKTVYDNAGIALGRGLYRLGLEPLVYLAPALGVLAQCADERTLVAQWLAGAPVFAGAEIPGC